MVERIRHYIVRIDTLREIWNEDRERVIVQRPTPWSLFLSGVFLRGRLGFVVMNDCELSRFFSGKYAVFFDGKQIKSNGDFITLQKWSVMNVVKFCVEGFQYGTFLRFLRWKW